MGRTRNIQAKETFAEKKVRAQFKNEQSDKAVTLSDWPLTEHHNTSMYARSKDRGSHEHYHNPTSIAHVVW